MAGLTPALTCQAVEPAGTWVKLVAFNDFHGQLESPGSLRTNAASATPSLPVGGVDWMAAYVANLKAQNPRTLVVSAGDIIGATPLVSALFHDEPTIEAMNRLGLDFNAVGNHEFDEGGMNCCACSRAAATPPTPTPVKAPKLAPCAV